MPLDFLDQLNVMRNSLSRGDFDLLVRTIKEPELTTPEESKTVAESLGLSNGFAKWVVNVATDPMVWIATLLAAKYPHMLWSRGIPSRLLGSATEFTGISKLTRPVYTYFRGSGIEEMITLGMHRQAHVNRLMVPVSNALGSLTAEEKVALIRFREEGLVAGVTEKVRNVDRLMTKTFTQGWNALASQVTDVRGGLEMPGKHGMITYGPFRERVGGKLIPAPKMPLEFRNYVPHLPILSSEGTMTLSGAEALTRMAEDGGTRLKQALAADGLPLRFATAVMDDGSKRQIATRLGPWRVNTATDAIESSLAEWQQAMRGQTGRVFFGHLEKRHRNVALHSAYGKRNFVLDIDQIFAEYTRGLSRTYAWNAPLSQEERLIGAFARENPNPTERLGRFFADATIPTPLTEEPLLVQIQKTALNQIGVKAEPFVVRGTEKWHQPVRGYRFRMTNEPLKIQAMEHLVRSLKGGFNEKDMLFGNAFSAIAGGLERATRGLSPELAGKLATQFEVLKRKGTNRAIHNFLATYSYYTTLGVNISSALGNSLQTPLTTLPSVGVGATLKGIAEFAGRLPGYSRQVVREMSAVVAERGGANIHTLPTAARRAWAKSFPELAEFRIEVDPRLFEIDEGSLMSAQGGKFFRNSDAYLNWLLTPFRAVETMNRSIAFFGARHDFAHKFRISPKLTGIPEELLGKGGEMTAAAHEFVNLHAARTVNATQFLPGGGTRTIAQDMVAPWLRTFSTFPLRFMSWMGESTVKGALMEKELKLAGWFERKTGGRNFGPLARLYLTGAVLQSGFRDVLGLDINNWVGFRPLEPGGEPLVGPIPIPPIAGALINTATAINEREWDRMEPVELPGVGKMPIPKVLVPAGVAMSRASRAINQFEPDLGGFVDEDDRLMRRAGTVDLILSMLGVPTDKARRERLQLTSVRSRISRVKQFRRRFAQSLINGDLDEAARTKAQYAETFPDMLPLNVAEEDLETYAQNARVPRLGRALRSLGAQRPFIQEQLIEMDPGMIAPVSPLENAIVDLEGR
jgi:hypothetical protein